MVHCTSTTVRWSLYMVFPTNRRAWMLASSFATTGSWDRRAEDREKHGNDTGCEYDKWKLHPRSKHPSKSHFLEILLYIWRRQIALLRLFRSSWKRKRYATASPSKPLKDFMSFHALLINQSDIFGILNHRHFPKPCRTRMCVVLN